MAKYRVTYSCGHDGTVDLVGPKRTREWMLKRKEDELCPDCYQAKRDEGRKAALAEAEEQGLPTLVGSEKQIAWAVTIRKEFLQEFTTTLEKYSPKPDLDQVLVQETIESIMRETSAAWWIENGRDTTIRKIQSLIVARYKELQDLRESAGATTVSEVLVEATVRPEIPISEIPVEIKISGDLVTVDYPVKNDEFREIVKSRNFRWDPTDRVWYRDVDQFAGGTINRASEIGNLLLRAGFVVRIFDEGVRAKAIAGDYEAEHTLWITKLISGTYTGWFAVSWHGKNDNLYRASRAIAGSRWSRPNVVVPPEQFEAVLDLADKYGFRLSSGAEEVVDLARMAKEDALIVKPGEGPDPTTGEPKTQTPPGEIDAELRDDD